MIFFTVEITNYKRTVPNSRFAKTGVSCFYNSEVQNSNFVYLMKFSAENPAHRQYANL